MPTLRCQAKEFQRKVYTWGNDRIADSCMSEEFEGENDRELPKLFE